MSKKVFRTIGKVAGIVAAVAAIGTGVGAVLGGTMMLTALGGTIAASTIATIGSAVALGASMLGRPKAPSTSPATSDRLQANIDPSTPRKFVLGRTAMATDIRDQEFSNQQELLHRFIVCASHKVDAIEEIWLDDEMAWSAAGGISSKYLGYLGFEGYTEGSPATAKNISARMGSNRRYTGLAWIYLRFKLTGNSKKAESPFAQSVPSRLTIIGKGALTYDPRLDSTVPGGSGLMRANDQSTWAWSDSASRNPALQLLWYLLGWRIQNPATGQWRLAVGKGIPPARIDLASFITAANLCDEPVTLAAGGTQPRYRSDALFSEGDATSVVLEQLKAAMNAELDDVDGKIRITVLHNDLAVPIADFSEDDILSGFTWEQTAPLDETYNVVRGTYIDPSPNSLYQAVDFPEVRITSPDGIDRIETVTFQAVQSPAQAQRLVKQRVARMLYSGRFTATFSFRAWRVQKNDVIRLTFAPLGWSNKLFRVIETSVQVDGQVPMVLQVEHPDIYLWDRDERPAIQPVQPTSYDPYLNPVYRDVIDPKYADGTSIDSLKPAEPGATKGATGDDPVGDTTAQKVIDALMALASTTTAAEIVEGARALVDQHKNNLLAVYGGQILAEERRARWERLLHLDGVEVKTRVRQEIIERIEQGEAIVALVTEIEASATNGISAALAAIEIEQAVRASADQAETAARELAISLFRAEVSGEVTNLQAAIVSEGITRANAIGAEAALREALQASLENDLAQVNAAVLNETAARVTAVQAEATAREALAATLTTDIADVSALVLQEQTARVTEDEALASQVTTLSASLNGASARIETIEAVQVTDQAAVALLSTTVAARTSSRIELVAIGGDNRAELRLWADANGGAGARLVGDLQISGDLTIDGTLKPRKIDASLFAREGTAVWSGIVTPGVGQTLNVPFSLTLSPIQPQGRFFYEIRTEIDTNAGQSFTGTFNGKPFITSYVGDGGLSVRSYDDQGNIYVPRDGRNEAVRATTPFSTTFVASVSRGTLDTGVVDDGDYYYRQISASYTVTRIDLHVVWIAV